MKKIENEKWVKAYTDTLLFLCSEKEVAKHFDMIGLEAFRQRSLFFIRALLDEQKKAIIKEYERLKVIKNKDMSKPLSEKEKVKEVIRIGIKIKGWKRLRMIACMIVGNEFEISIPDDYKLFKIK